MYCIIYKIYFNSVYQGVLAAVPNQAETKFCRVMFCRKLGRDLAKSGPVATK